MVSLKVKSTQDPMFVRVLSDENFNSKLTISKEDLTDLNGGKFWGKIYVKGPISKEVHQIGVEIGDLSVTFEQGWNDLVEKNNIQRNYILIFLYEELNLFDMVICDNTGKKIKESRGNQNEEEGNRTGLSKGCFGNNFEVGGPSRKRARRNLSDKVPENGSIKEEIIEINGVDTCSGENDKISRDRADKSNKGKNIVDQSSNSETEGSESDSEEKSWDSDSDSHDWEFFSSDSYCSDSFKEAILKMTRNELRSKRILKSNCRSVMKYEKDSAKLKAKNFKLENPNFMKEMKDVYRGFNLTVPVGFARKFFQRKSTKVCLKVVDKGSNNNGGIWRVGCNFTFSRNQETWRFGSGWKVFSFENNLEEGDCCVFELTKRERENNGEEMIELTVHIFRVVKKIVPKVRK